jgi:hypothetical protein
VQDDESSDNGAGDSADACACGLLCRLIQNKDGLSMKSRQTAMGFLSVMRRRGGFGFRIGNFNILPPRLPVRSTHPVDQRVFSGSTMKRYMLLAAITLALTIPSVAWCQSGAPGGGQAGDGQQFQQRKAEILKHISDRLAEIQQRQSCVEAANNHEALRACMPHRGEGRGDQ